MNLTPEGGAWIRDGLKLLGMYLVARGVLEAKDAATWATLADAAAPLLLSSIGSAITAIGIWWSRRAKRATSKEAQQIAGRVEANPNTQPIVPPGPLDVKAKDLGL